MLKRIQIPLKYKFLGVMLFVMFVGFGAFFYYAHQTFSEDKKLFVMELNLAALKATTSDIKLELRGRIEELQIFVPRVYQPPIDPETNAEMNPYKGLSGRLEEEVLAVTFLQKKEGAPSEVVRHYKNIELLKKLSLTEEIYDTLEKTRPLPASPSVEQGFELVNRAIRVNSNGNPIEVPVLTVILNGNFMNDDSHETVIAVDLTQDFLRKKLQQAELTEIFLVSKRGTLISHAENSKLVDYATIPFNHPIARRLQDKQFPRESLEIEVGNEAYLCNVSETGFADIFAVSQVKKSQAFLALRLLMQNTIFIAVLIFSFALVLSILFARGLTKNIKKLKDAAETIGKGNWDIKLDVNTNDEVQSVADSFQWMADRLTELVKETAQKARMEEELETARLVQSTLLANPEIKSDFFELAPFYFPASECGGDLWDVYQTGSKVTLVIGDATGHGAGAAIVTAVAKSGFSTLNTIYAKQDMPPDQFLTILNKIICKLCKGQLLMTMVVVQLDLRTGEVVVCNAGHESPLLLKNATGKGNCEVLFSRGERLGFSDVATFEPEKFQLQVGETILLYTDGVSEAKNGEGKELGERALKKLLSVKGPRPLADIRKDIEDGTKGHIGTATIEDDITFVLLNWKQAATAEDSNTESKAA